jgi:hypothetical protein
MLGASGAHRNIAEETGKNRDPSKRASTVFKFRTVRGANFAE